MSLPVSRTHSMMQHVVGEWVSQESGSETMTVSSLFVMYTVAKPTMNQRVL